MQLTKERVPAIIITDSQIDTFLSNELPGITLAVYIFVERSEFNIIEEKFIAKSLGFDYLDVIASLKLLQSLGYIKINS